MTETSPGTQVDPTSSSAQLGWSGQDSDVEEPADLLSYKSALLAEDPLEEEGQPQSVSSYLLGSTITDYVQFEL